MPEMNIEKLRKAKFVGFYMKKSPKVRVFEVLEDCEIPIKTSKGTAFWQARKGDLVAKDTDSKGTTYPIEKETFLKIYEKIGYLKGDKNAKRQKP